jgi:hypothetical protein
VLGEAMRLETVDVWAYGGEAEMLESEFPGTGANLAAGAGIRAACGRVETATNVARGAGELGEETVAGAIKTASCGGGGRVKSR